MWKWGLRLVSASLHHDPTSAGSGHVCVCCVRDSSLLLMGASQCVSRALYC